MARADRSRRALSGAALLEALVALSILATAGVAVVGFAGEAIRSVGRTRAAERDVRRASALLDAVALWPREDLDRHLGSRAEGPWRMLIERPTPSMYTVILRDSSSGHEVLHTALFRPESVRRDGSDALR